MLLLLVISLIQNVHLNWSIEGNDRSKINPYKILSNTHEIYVGGDINAIQIQILRILSNKTGDCVLFEFRCLSDVQMMFSGVN